LTVEIIWICGNEGQACCHDPKGNKILYFFWFCSRHSFLSSSSIVTVHLETDASVGLFLIFVSRLLFIRSKQAN